MDDDELAAMLAAHEKRSIGYLDSEISSQQARAINYYYGTMDDLPALEGCSSAIDPMVAVMVDNGLASILKPFVSAEEVVSFDPANKEDIEQAEQATEYVNYVINKDNPGFLIFHNWFKDALLTKIGIVKVWWEDKTRAEVKEVQVDEMGLLMARQDPKYLDEKDNGDGTFTVSIEETIEDGREKVCGVPPEEFLISPHARSLEPHECPYVAHKPANFTRSDAIELGIDPKIVEGLPAYAPDDSGEARRQARYADQEWYSSTNEAVVSDRSSEVIAILDEFVRCDYDGDGIAELRRVIRVDTTILFNEKVEDNAFAILCPVPMPHKVIGRSLADQSMEGQKVRTAVKRQTLDNLYKSNNPRPVVADAARGENTDEDLLENAPGAQIRVKTAGQLDFMVVPFTAEKSFAMMEMLAQEVEEQTGIQRKGMGFNAEALKKNSSDTATEAAIDENSRNERAELIARIFAETGVKRLFRLILKDLVKYQPKARLIRLRNKFVEMDPSGWNPEMDLTISVGLGMGNKSEQIMQAQSVLNTMAELAQSPYSHLINSENVYNALKRSFVATGIKNVDDYVVEPQKDEQGKVIEPEPGPDPEMAKVEAQVRMKQIEMQAQQQERAYKLQMDQAEKQAKIQLAQVEAEADAEVQRFKVQTNAQLEREKAEFQAKLALQESQQEFELQKLKLANERELGEARAQSDYEVKMAKNREGGDLSK